MPKKQRLLRTRYLPAVMTSCVGVALSLVAFAIVWNWEDKRKEYEFGRRTDSIATVLQQDLDSDLEVMRNVRDFFAASIFVEAKSFERFVKRPLSNHRNIQLLAWIPRVTDAERQTYEEAARATESPTFKIVEKDPQGKLVTAREHPEYFPIQYVQPMAGNSKNLGFNLASYPAYLWALKQAKEELFVTEQIEWILGSDNQLGFLAIQPIYQNDLGARSPQQTSSNTGAPAQLQGFIVGVFRLADIFQVSLEKGSFNNLNLYLCDETPARFATRQGTVQGNRVLAIYESTQLFVQPDAPKPTNCPIKPVEVNLGKFVLDGDLEGSRRTLKVGGRKWGLYILPTSDYQGNLKHWRSWATLIIGLLWTHIPVTYLLTSLVRTVVIEQLAKERAIQAEKLRQAFRELEAEQAKSERLLLNVLPKAIADRLKQNQNTIADSFAEVTVLFADIVGFTNLATRISPRELVKVLNRIFSAFDNLAQIHGLEKIKTIGDAYMVVGGLPTIRSDHAEAIAEMALDMQDEIAKFDIENNEAFTMRIGIHTGPVVAGVIGTNKFIYDLWGDTVNTASRMESHGIPGCIQVTDVTYELLRDKYWLEKRGSIPVKGKGQMTTYLLIGRKSREVSPSPLAFPNPEMSRNKAASQLGGEQAIA